MEGKDDTKIWGRFYLQKQEESPAKFGRPGRPGLYLTNPEKSDKLVLAKQDFSTSQTWRWANNMLLCDTGKVLDIDGNFKAGQGAPLLAWEPHGGENQKFCPFKIVCPMTDKEYCFIGRLAEEDVQGDRLFLTVPEEGPACLETINSFHLLAKNMTNTIEMCWKFVFRQIEAKEGKQRETESPIKGESAEKEASSKLDENKEGKKEEASLGDFMGVMGGLMAAFAPPEQGKEIQKQFQQMGQAMGPMFEGLAQASEALDAAPYHWVKMETNELPENALAAGKDQSEICNVFVGRAEVDGEPCVGKVHNNTRYYGSDMREKRVTSEPFSVLCVDPSADIEWVEYKEGDLPTGIVIGGTSTNGTHLYVGRGLVRNQLTPGMVFIDEEPYQLHALYDGNVNTMTAFEVLVIKHEAKEVIKESSEKQKEEAKEEDMKDEKIQKMGDILDEIENIEATIESEEEKYKKEMASLKEQHRKEMENLKQELKIKRKELKDDLTMK